MDNTAASIRVDPYTQYQRMRSLIDGIPVDGLWPGFEVSDETRLDYSRVNTLLVEARHLLERCSNF
jgi:hypothetical protein